MMSCYVCMILNNPSLQPFELIALVHDMVVTLTQISWNRFVFLHYLPLFGSWGVSKVSH